VEALKLQVAGERSAPAPESGTFALRVLGTLPQAHQRFVFDEICGLCRHYLRSKPEDASDISSEELVSEVWAKLIGSITMPDPSEAAERSNFPDPSDWTIDPHAPENDGRVIWLIREVGRPRALAHRCEDIRRRLAPPFGMGIGAFGIGPAYKFATELHTPRAKSRAGAMKPYPRSPLKNLTRPVGISSVSP
jgi:hypothetical protein